MGLPSNLTYSVFQSGEAAQKWREYYEQAETPRDEMRLAIAEYRGLRSLPMDATLLDIKTTILDCLGKLELWALYDRVMAQPAHHIPEALLQEIDRA